MHVYKNYSDLSFNYMFLKSNLLFSDMQVATKPQLLKILSLDSITYFQFMHLTLIFCFTVALKFLDCSAPY